MHEALTLTFTPLQFMVALLFFSLASKVIDALEQKFGTWRIVIGLGAIILLLAAILYLR